MIRLYTDLTLIKDDMLDDYEAFFDANVSPADFSDLDLEVMRRIDTAELLDIKTGAIKTMYGTTDISNLSSGCKIVLSYLYIMRNKDEFSNQVVIDISYCGINAVEVLFDMADKLEDSQTIFYRYLPDMYKIHSARKYIINDKKIITDSQYL